jgi:uncharacterized repeat protein (TIGR02543 family)
MIGGHKKLGKVARFATTFIVSTVLASTLIVVGLDSVASATGSTISQVSGFPVNLQGSGLTSLAVSPANVGDIIVFESQIHSQTISVSSVTCPKTGTFQRATKYVDTNNGIITEEVWWAVAASTGATSITVNYSTGVSGVSNELVADSFTTSNATAWSLVAGQAGGTFGTATTTITYPTLTSNGDANQLYWGYAQSTVTASAGSSPGFVYHSTAAGNLVTSNPALSANTGYTPTASASPAGNDTATGAIFAAVPTFTVTFNGNTSTGGGPISPETNSSATALTANTFTKTGYTFSGWNTLANGTGTSYTDGGTYPFTANATLYAQWTADFYSVTFLGNGNTSGTMNAESDNAPTALTANAFVRTGYTFTGWNTLANGSGTNYADGASYPFLAPLTLYAQWTASYFNVTFDGNGSTSGTMGVENHNAPTALTTNTFVRTGYTFNGWNTAANGSGNSFADGASYPFLAAATMYAQWTADYFSVTFAGNGSTSGTMSAESANTPTALTANAFVRTGYTFTGWNTVADGSGTKYANRASYPFAAAATLYAQWTADYSKVTFKGNGSTSGTMNAESDNAPTALTANTFSRTGYTFAYWSTSANGKGTKYANRAKFSFKEGVTLYAQWAAVIPHASRIIGTISAGKTQNVTIDGTGFLGTSKVTSNAVGTKVSVLHVTNTRVLLHVTVAKGTRRGTHTLKMFLRNGKTCTIRYLSR